MENSLNSFLKSKIIEDENKEFKDIIPSFLFNDDIIISELKKLERNDAVELFDGVYLALNQLGEKLFHSNTNVPVNEEFKQKILNYNDKADVAFKSINDLIFSDVMTAIETEYKANGLAPFYNDKFENKTKKIKHNII
jgi:GTP-dependent phosphoenolpyruvate carboxykinase